MLKRKYNHAGVQNYNKCKLNKIKNKKMKKNKLINMK